MKIIIVLCLYTSIITLALLGALFFILKAYDYYLIKREMYSRKGIGDFKTKDQWKDSVRSVSCKWIVHMPKVQVSDNINFVLLEKLGKNYSKNELQSWQRAGLLLGMAQYCENNPKDADAAEVVSKALKDIFDDKFSWRIKPEYVDHALLAYSVMKTSNYNDNYYEAMQEIVDILIDSTGIDGTIYYRRHIQNYRLVDTLGMICPFLIRFAYLYNMPDLVERAILQLEKYIENGIHPLSKIPAHAYHIMNKMPLGIYGWGRGVGWYALGIINSYEELHDSHPQKEVLKSRVEELGEALITYQRMDGGWGHSFIVDDNIYDSSVTVMAVYFLKKALELNILNDRRYMEAINRGLDKLKLSTRVDGTIDFSQGDTKGIGIYSTVFRELPFTQGLVLAVLS